MSNQYRATAETLMPASADVVYEIISDYQDLHPAILPSQYFKKMRVEAGGRGAGTVFTVEMNVYGYKTTLHMTVTEPELGRVLREEDEAQGMVTYFTVTPLDNNQCHVAIETTAVASPGLRGWLEKMTTPAIMRHIFRVQLDNLAALACERQAVVA